MSKEPRQKPDETCGDLTEEKHSDCNEKEEEEEIRWFDNYERRIRAEAAESFRHKDLLNYFRNIRREYCSEISSDDDYKSSSVREFDDVRTIRSVKGKRTRSMRTKQGFRSRHRKARPKRKTIHEIFECPSRNYEFCDLRCPSYERQRYINGDHVESFTRYLIPNKYRPKFTYRVSRLSKRHSSRLISPKWYGRYLKRGSKEWQGVNNIEIVKSWSDQRIPRTKNEKERHPETQRSNRRNNSIYINPSFERSYLCHEETTTSRKEPEVRSCVLDKTNENSFQKRLSGGSNFSGSTNNQYCPRLDGPSSGGEREDDEVEEEKKKKGVNKSRSSKCEKDASRKEEKKIRAKSDWISKDPLYVGSGSRYPHSRSFSNLSLVRSTKGVTFERDASEIPCKTPSRQMPRSARESEKTSFVEKRVHYEPQSLSMNDTRKDDEDLCYLCENERINDESDRRSPKLCKLVTSREEKKLLNCCCSEDEQEDNTECDQYCCCPENVQMFQARPQYDTSRTYEKLWKGKDILHSTSLPGTSFGPNSSKREFMEDSCNRNDRSKDQTLRYPSPDMLLSDHLKPCKDCLKNYNEEYRQLSNDVKSIREIYCSRDKGRKKSERFYPSIERDIPFETRTSQRRNTDSRSSPSRPNKIQETDCDCTEFLTKISPSTCRYDRYSRTYNRRDTESTRKLENDSVRKLENFCDKVKAMNRRPFESKTKTNLKNRTLDEDSTWCDCRYDSETSVQELWKPSKRSTRKEWSVGNSVNLRIVKPKKSYGKTNLEEILIYPPEGAAGPPLTLFKNSSNISCQVKGDVDRGYRYNVTYVQKFVSPSWRPAGERLSNTMRRNRNECDCSSDHG